MADATEPLCPSGVREPEPYGAVIGSIVDPPKNKTTTVFLISGGVRGVKKEILGK